MFILLDILYIVYTYILFGKIVCPIPYLDDDSAAFPNLTVCLYTLSEQRLDQMEVKNIHILSLWQLRHFVKKNLEFKVFLYNSLIIHIAILMTFQTLSSLTCTDHDYEGCCLYGCIHLCPGHVSWFAKYLFMNFCTFAPTLPPKFSMLIRPPWPSSLPLIVRSWCTIWDNLGPLGSLWFWWGLSCRQLFIFTIIVTRHMFCHL